MVILGLLMVILWAALGKSEVTACSRKHLVNSTLYSMLQSDACQNLDLEHA
jgi:hypothetical protein